MMKSRIAVTKVYTCKQTTCFLHMIFLTEYAGLIVEITV